MSKYGQYAAEVAHAARYTEDKKLGEGLNEYTDDVVRTATVHTREDVAALFVLVDILNVQLRSIRWALWVIMAILSAALYRVW